MDIWTPPPTYRVQRRPDISCGRADIPGLVLHALGILTSWTTDDRRGPHIR